MLVVCPEDVHEGDLIVLEAPDGRDVEVEVPPGVEPGDEFEVEVDGPRGEPQRD